MKALAINGSPGAGGNTEILLKKVLEPVEAAGWSTEYRRACRGVASGMDRTNFVSQCGVA